MIYIVGILAFVTVVLAVLGVYATVYGERLEVTRRMQELTSALTRKKQLDDELSKPFTERVTRPAPSPGA